MKSLVFIALLFSNAVYAVKEPQACNLGGESLCMIRSAQYGKYDTEKFTVILKPGATLASESFNKLRYLEGDLYLSTGQNAVQLLIFAQEITVVGELFLKEENGIVKIVNIGATIKSNSSVLPQEVMPIQGMALSITKPFKLADLRYGFPEPLEANWVFNEINQYQNWSYFKPRLEAYSKTIQGSRATASELYQEVARRKLAAAEEKWAKDQKKREALEAEKRKLRELYRKKNYLD